MEGLVIEGPLAGVAEGFAERLRCLGYKRRAAERQVALLAHLSCWMEKAGTCPRELSAAGVAEFLAERRRLGYARLVTDEGMGVLLGYLREMGALPAAGRPEPSGPLDVVMGRYTRFLLLERGLRDRTVEHYEMAARLFARAVGVEEEADLGRLSAADVSRFVVGACARPVKMSPRELVSALRAFLRFCHLEGLTATVLAGAVPSYASWRGTSLPKNLPPSKTSRLLRSCDRRRAQGRRDYAMLTCLLRLGLRAGEVAGLRLEDFDWRAGELVVHGKGPRTERMPLPSDVGEAVAGYLRRGRPSTPDRSVFVRLAAPLVGLSSGGVTEAVYAACDRAGLPRVGAHALRHSAASDMLRAGGSLAEIGQVPRHRNAGTTAICAKVDRVALAELARPWPGGGR